VPRGGFEGRVINIYINIPILKSEKIWLKVTLWKRKGKNCFSNNEEP
jgi:hypothetical protein